MMGLHRSRSTGLAIILVGVAFFVIGMNRRGLGNSGSAFMVIGMAFFVVGLHRMRRAPVDPPV